MSTYFGWQMVIWFHQLLMQYEIFWQGMHHDLMHYELVYCNISYGPWSASSSNRNYTKEFIVPGPFCPSPSAHGPSKKFEYSVYLFALSLIIFRSN